MKYPTSAEEAHEYIHQGRLIQVMRNTPGYLDIFKKDLQELKDKANAECHDFKLREDRGKYAIVKYNTIEKIMSICDEYIKNMEVAVEYCKDNNIPF